MSTRFLSARSRLLTGVGVTLVALIAVACGATTAAPPAAVVPSPTLAVATPSTATVEPTAAPADPTVEPTVAPSQEAPTATPVPTATTEPAQTPAPPTPVVLSEIAFGESYTQTSNGVVLDNASDRFEGGTSVAWRVELPPAVGTETILVQVVDANGAIIYNGSHTPEAGSNIFFGEAVLATSPGSYTMRYLLDDDVIAEGAFRLRAVAVVAPRPDPTVAPRPDPTPKPTPKPTRKPDNDPPQDNCDPSYPTLCLRSSPDLDCGEISARQFPVRGRDPHGFDADGDGIGCES